MVRPAISPGQRDDPKHRLFEFDFVPESIRMAMHDYAPRSCGENRITCPNGVTQPDIHIVPRSRFEPAFSGRKKAQSIFRHIGPACCAPGMDAPTAHPERGHY